MNTVKSNYDTSPALGDYNLGMIGWHAPGNFYAIFTADKCWMSLTTGERYFSEGITMQNAHMHILPPGTVVTITVG